MKILQINSTYQNTYFERKIDGVLGFWGFGVLDILSFGYFEFWIF